MITESPPPSETISVLVVEDSESDALLLLRHLQKAGFTLHHARVDTLDEVFRALREGHWDVVISDFSLPGFDALAVLQAVQASGLDLPFIVVSGTIPDEVAVSLMRAGAHDYLMKSNLTRLGAVLRRELGEASSRAQRRRMESELRVSEQRLREAQRIARLGHWARDLPNGLFRCSETLLSLFGLEPEHASEAEKLMLMQVHPQDASRLQGARETLQRVGDRIDLEYRVVRAPAEIKVFHEIAETVHDPDTGVTRVTGTVQDVSNARLAETAIKLANQRLRRLSGRVLEAQEAERRELARELHDQVGQGLTAVKLELQRLAAYIEEGPGVAHLASALGVADEALAQVRALSLNLRPPQLDYMGLDASMRWHAETQCARAGLILSYVSELGDQRYDSRSEIVVFRLMQEALTNVIRHARAKEVNIEIVVDPEALEMAVVDDGNGFDVELARRRMLHGQSTGLLGMEERAHLVGGDLDIVSEPGGGTTVRLRLPIKESNQP